MYETIQHALSGKKPGKVLISEEGTVYMRGYLYIGEEIFVRKLPNGKLGYVTNFLL